MKKAVILGAGGHARVVAECIDAGSYEIIGYLDKDEIQNGTVAGHYPILGDDRMPDRWLKEGIQACIVGLGNLGGKSATLRERLFDIYKEAGFEMLTAIHSSAVISPDVRIGEGTVIMPGAVVNSGALIGRNAIVNSGAVIEHDVIIEDGVHIAPGSIVSGGSRIGKNTFVGAGSCIIQGLTIGSRVIIGAGSTVLQDLPSDVMAAGTPARIRTVLQ